MAPVSEKEDDALSFRGRRGDAVLGTTESGEKGSEGKETLALP